MNNNNYDAYERRVRHIMCIFLSIETLILCILMIIDSLGYWEYEWGFWEYGDILTRLHYHLVTPDRVLSADFWIFCIGAIVCTLLSIRFKWFCRVYEGVHCLLGIIIFSGLFFEAETGFVGFIIFLLLSARFCIYIYLTKIKL